jgi:hypothetical protein
MQAVRVGEGQEGPEVRVDPMLTKCLRDHQREGLQFLFDCVTGQKTGDGQGWCDYRAITVVSTISDAFRWNRP